MGLKAEARVHRRIADIGRQAWDRCANPPGQPADPFISYDFLDILEQSLCAVERCGWAPQHLTIEDQAGAVGAVMPLYLKSHSQGEYVFDHAWADAYERAGGRYYPKLTSAAPFSPVTGRRLLVREDMDVDAGRTALLDGALTLCGRFGASTLGVNFPTEAEWRFMAGRGMLARQNQQY
ncbi:MAG: peptidogalycan biosysnthesis protein, partial [Caulobacteraceae bacterium]